MSIQLKMCQGSGCKSESDILKFFKNKYLLVLVNEANFITDKFGEQRVERESRAHWLRINTFIPQTKPF